MIPYTTFPECKTHSSLVKFSVKYLRGWGCLAWPHPTGSWRPEGATRNIHYGYVGSSDAVAVLPEFSLRPGVFLGVESKTTDDIQKDKQEEFEFEVKRRMGIYILIYSPQELERAVLPLFHPSMHHLSIGAKKREKAEAIFDLYAPAGCKGKLPQRALGHED